MKQKCDKAEEGLNAQRFIILSGLKSNYDLIRLQSIVLKVLLIISHFKTGRKNEETGKNNVETGRKNVETDLKNKETDRRK